jgi:hypothetical protein
MRVEREIRHPETDCPRGEHWRTRIEFDDEFGVTYLADEQLTSAAKRAQFIEGTTLEFTEETVRWVHATFGELIRYWDRRNGDPKKPDLPLARPQNDVDHVEALKFVADDAKAAFKEWEKGPPTDQIDEELADAMGELRISLDRLRKIESKVVPIRALEDEDS